MSRVLLVLCVVAGWASGAEEQVNTDVKNVAYTLETHDKFEDNLQEDGTVKIMWRDGSSYKGGWENGKKSGEGTYLYADKKIYKGNWLDDMYHGVGVLRTPSGASYNGMWKQGVQEGQGELRYADGSLYFGDFFNNMQHGYGILKYMDGSSYEGNWRDGMPEGFGVFKKANGVVEYEGEFERGMRKEDIPDNSSSEYEEASADPSADEISDTENVDKDHMEL